MPAPRPPTSAAPAVVASALPPTASAVPLGSPRDRTLWSVPVFADDPFKGKPDALVTIVAFSELESPLCKEAAETLDTLLREFPNDLRLVWKDFPLPFEEHALPAALFARAVYARCGNEGFWKAQELLFASQPKLASADLETVAQKLAVPATLVASSRRDRSVRTKIASSVMLGYDVQAKGIPHFFINGTRLAGSQPLAKVRRIVEEELEKARTRLVGGTPRSALYEAIVRDGQKLPALPRLAVAPPDSSAPSWGLRTAPVIIEVWQRLPCDQCPTALAQAEALERESEGRIRLIFRFAGAEDTAASLGIQALREAFAERGYDAFKPMYQRLASATTPAKSGTTAPARAELEGAAAAAGLDVKRFKSALDARQHEAAVRAESLAAERAAIVAPAFLVEGYYLPAPNGNFELRRAIAHAERDKRASH